MATISREQALCICFLYEYNDQNVEKAEKELKDMGGKFDVCYLTDPTIPVFAHKEQIYTEHPQFRKYESMPTGNPNSDYMDNNFDMHL
ncbi:unnamed protein product [Absidia cylindrospora]